MMFFWRLPSGDVAEARRIVSEIRQKAVELGWQPVGEVLHLADEQCVQDARLPTKFLLIASGESVLVPHEVLFFTAQPPGDGSQPFGLATYPGHIEGQVAATPTHLGGWCWVGAIRPHDLRPVAEFMRCAVELGLPDEEQSALGPDDL